MALSQADRIAISKKLVDIPRENERADKTKASLAETKVDLVVQDDANKNLVESETPLINLYQQEIARYDGNGRTELVEQNFIDSANRIKNNPFFPNDPLLSLPNLASGVWINFIPYSYTQAIGRNFNETYNVATKEQDIIDAINIAIADMEALSNPTRSTGLECVSSGTCSMPAFDNQIDCVGGGGTWTPGPDIIQSSVDMVAAGDALKAAVQAWEDFVNGTIAVVPTTDTDATRAPENVASIADANNAIVQINAWQAIQDYATHGTTGCVAFNAIDVNTLDPSKFRAAELQIIKDEITARQAFTTTRLAQVNGHLGSIVQDTEGNIVSATGFYGNRFRFIDLRLNAIGGTLTRVLSIERGEDAQDKFKEANANAEIAYNSVMVAIAFRAPASNTKNVHVLDSTGFSVSDTVYVTSDTQQEITATIEQIDGNRIVLSVVIPEKYRTSEIARLYKDL